MEIKDKTTLILIIFNGCVTLPLILTWLFFRLTKWIENCRRRPSIEPLTSNRTTHCYNPPPSYDYVIEMGGLPPSYDEIIKEE